MKLGFFRLLTFVILIPLLNCQQDNTSNISNRIVITGQMEGANIDTYPVIAFDKIFSGYEEATPIFFEKGNFRFDLESDVPFDLLFIYESATRILIYPGDSINILIHSDKTLTFSGDRTEENQNIQAFLELFEPIDQNYSELRKIGFKQSQEDFLNTVDSLKSQSNKLLDLFIDTHEIDNVDITTWLNNHILTSYYSLLIGYINANSSSKLEKVKEALDTKFPIDKEGFINNHALNRFKYEYLYEKILEEIIDEVNEDNYHAQLLNAICDFKNDDLMRQLFFIEIVSPQLGANNVALLEEFMEAKDSIITDPYLNSKLESMYKEVKSRIVIAQIREGVFISDSLKSIKSLIDSILIQNKGKVIYLDLWATWCRPCQQEFKNQESFKKAFEGKDVQFIYICASSSDISAWKATVDQYDLDGINIYLDEAQFEEFKENYNFSGFPTYLLFDKFGNLDTENFHWRPSLPETLEKVNSML